MTNKLFATAILFTIIAFALINSVSAAKLIESIPDDDHKEEKEKKDKYKCDSECHLEKAEKALDKLDGKKKDKKKVTEDNPVSDETQAKEDAKKGNDLTIILKAHYNLPGKWYKNVRIDVDEGDYSKKYDLSKQPKTITIKHLKIPEGHSFEVSINNDGTDDGENYRGHNSVCKCPEVLKVKIP